MLIIVRCLLVLIALTRFASAEVVVNEPHSERSSNVINQSRLSFGESRASRQKVDQDTNQSFFIFREKHRLGLSSSFGSYSGVLGVGLEANLSGSDSALINAGSGEGFTSVTGSWKHYLSDSSLSPFFSTGYTRWARESKSEVEKTTPSFLADRFLTSEEKSRGQFVKDIVFLTAGLQYTVLNGKYKGLGAYIEVSFLTSLRPLEIATTPGLGLLFLL